MAAAAQVQRRTVAVATIVVAAEPPSHAAERSWSAAGSAGTADAGGPVGPRPKETA
jgi:hypothetical protein